MADGILTPCNVACGSGMTCHWIRQVAAPCTCNGRWLCDEMPLDSPKRLPYWNSTSGFDFGHITAVDMSFCASLRNFIQIGPLSAEKNDVISIFKMADLRHLVFKGSNNGLIEKPTYDFHPSSIDTIAVNCLFFEKITFLHFGVEIQDSRWISVFSIDHCWVVIWTVQYSLYHVIVDRLLATN